MMNEKPILFSTDFIPHILSGAKTQTRRVVKRIPKYLDDLTVDDLAALGIKCPYGKVGDQLWVRETWAVHLSSDKIPPRNLGGSPMMWFKADNPLVQTGKGKWRPSIFMPRWASRIQLLVTAVRVERIQSISFADWKRDFIPSELEVDRALATFTGAAYQAERMEKLWDGINAKRGFSWASNPWTWVVDFELVRER